MHLNKNKNDETINIHVKRENSVAYVWDSGTSRNTTMKM